MVFGLSISVMFSVWRGVSHPVRSMNRENYNHILADFEYHLLLILNCKWIPVQRLNNGIHPAGLKSQYRLDPNTPQELVRSVADGKQR